MKEFLEILKYTFVENIKKKSFIISTVIILLIISLSMIIPGLISSDKSAGKGNTDVKKDSDKSIVYLVDKTGYFENSSEAFEKEFPKYKFKNEADNKIQDIKDNIKKEGKSFLAVIDMKKDVPDVEYYTQQYGEGPDEDQLSTVIKSTFTSAVLKKANVDDATVSKVLSNVNVNVNELGKSKWGGFFSSIFIVVILFFAIYFYGYGVSMSVASEKTSRVMELLVTSVKPSRIILGKTAGMGALGLLQLAMIILVGTVSYKLAFPGSFSIGGIKIDLSSFTPFAFVMIVIFFILGYTLYALMYAVVGATVSKAEDINSAMMPMSFVAILAFYFSYGTFAIPDSIAARIASLIPLTAPFSLPSRLVSTNVPLWEIGLSLLILLITITFVSMISVKLYSFAVLHYGDRLKIGTLFKISKEN